MTGLAAEEAHALADAFEASLRATILSFWYPRAIDVRGGYRVGWDARGCPARDERGIVSQARLVYVFARAARAGIRHDEMLVAAEHGASYLRTAMWDGAHDGFRVDARRSAQGDLWARIRAVRPLGARSRWRERPRAGARDLDV
jgi:mannose/cellobiose epimerase-like protein (N-acyl-D-glucosamine 2-epimerase family)